MKKIISLIIAMSLSIPALADWDEFVDSNYFEPTMTCVAVGGAAYLGAPKGNEAAYAAGGCIIGGLITYAINKHYEGKYNKAYLQKIDKMAESLKQFQELQANKAANGDEGPYSLRVREIVPAQVLSNGQVRAPTVSEKLVVPSADIRVGD
jgi:hypothetical protein